MIHAAATGLASGLVEPDAVLVHTISAAGATHIFTGAAGM